MATLVGETIGKYEVVDLLGAGGMARVYRAIQAPLGRDVALKILHPHLDDPDIRDRFLREARAVASLDHPNIVKVYDFDLVDEQCYMAMEFLDGQTLAARLQQQDQQPLPLDEALAITISVAEALSFAHQQGIVHRDVKPANVMLTQARRTVLTDFGIADLIHETRFTVDGGSAGTPSYMSPEQGLGERGDERSDIYSLGVVLYELLTGAQPYKADTLYGLIMQHINTPPPSALEVNPALPPAIEPVIRQAMAKAPDDRYQSCRELIEDLEAIRADRPLPHARMTPPAGWKGWSFSRPDSRRSQLVGGALLLLGLVIVGLLAFSGSNRPVSSEPAEAVVVKSMAAEPPAEIESMAVDPAMVNGFSETFDDNALGWMLQSGPAAAEMVDGVYRLVITQADTVAIGYPEYIFNYTDFVYEADAVLADGQPESGYGLVFRRQDARNFYVLAINGLGQWSIWRLQEGVWRELRNLPGGLEWTPTSAVRPPGQVNRLKVTASGPTFEVYVNDQPLLEEALVDPTFAEGGVGFYAASSRRAADPLAVAQFDNASLTVQADE